MAVALNSGHAWSPAQVHDAAKRHPWLTKPQVSACVVFYVLTGPGLIGEFSVARVARELGVDERRAQQLINGRRTQGRKAQAGLRHFGIVSRIGWGKKPDGSNELCRWVFHPQKLVHPELVHPKERGVPEHGSPRIGSPNREEKRKGLSLALPAVLDYTGNRDARWVAYDARTLSDYRLMNQRRPLATHRALARMPLHEEVGLTADALDLLTRDPLAFVGDLSEVY